MANKDSVSYTVTVAVVLCLICSAIVSTAAVMLKPAQVINKSLDFKRNVLLAAGMLEEGISVEEQFKKVDTRLVDLTTGKYTDAVAVTKYDQRKAAKNPDLSSKLNQVDDIAKLSRIEKYSKVYLATNKDGKKILILPVRGYGLWSTLYGLLAVESDFNTIVGLGFYEHGETPGLGGEVDNPRWKALWPGKKIMDNGELAISIIKGNVTPSTPQAEYKVDGLSGATLTSQGVHNLLHFWLSEQGYGHFLQNLKDGEA